MISWCNRYDSSQGMVTIYVRTTYTTYGRWLM